MFNEQETLRKYSMMKQDDESSTETYAQMVEEVEKVSELLQETRATLRETQDKLRESEQRSQLLMRHLENEDRQMQVMSNENEMLAQQDQRLREEVERLENEQANSARQRANPTDEDRLRQAVELLNIELTKTREKLQDAQIRVATQRSHINSIEKSNQMMMTHGMTESGDLGTCKTQLKEAQMEASDLLEEVAILREELSLQNRIAEEKLAFQFQGRIRGSVESEATKQLLAQRIRNEVTAEVNAVKEKEIHQLREEYKIVVMEKEKLNDQIETSRASVMETGRLKDEAPRLKYEVTRLLGMLEATKDDSAAAISELEFSCRIQIQAIQEQQAREKWNHISEMRKQWSNEREKEQLDFKQRMKSLAEETSRLLRRAESEKEEYANSAKKVIEEEKQQEIDELRQKLKHFGKKAEELLRDAAQENEANAEQIRKELEEERRRDILKFKSRIEHLDRENKTLKSRFGELGKEVRSIQESKMHFEQEAHLVREERKKLSKQLKTSEQSLKVAKGETFNLKRKNEMLRNDVESFKLALDEKVEEQESTTLNQQRQQKTEQLQAQIVRQKESKSQFDGELLEGEEEVVELRVEIDRQGVSLAKSNAEVDNLNLALSRSKDAFQQKVSDGDRTKEEVNNFKTQVVSLTGENRKLHIELKRFEQSHSLVSKELDYSKRLFKEEKVKSEQLISCLQGRVEVLTTSQPNSSNIESEKRKLRATLATTGKGKKEQVDLLETLLSKAARESLRIAKRLHECDRRFRFFLSEIDAGQFKDMSSITKYAADVESTSKGNAKLTRELQSTMRKLKETLRSWKTSNSGSHCELVAVKSHVCEDAIKSKQVEVVDDTIHPRTGQDDTVSPHMNLPARNSHAACFKGILKLSSADPTMNVEDGTRTKARKTVTWNAYESSPEDRDEDRITMESTSSTPTNERKGPEEKSLSPQQASNVTEHQRSSSGKSPESTNLNQPGRRRSALDDTDIAKLSTDASDCQDSSHSHGSIDLKDCDPDEIWASDESNSGVEEPIEIESSFVYTERLKRGSLMPIIEKSSGYLPRRALRHHPRKNPQTAKKGVRRIRSGVKSSVEITASDEGRDEMKQTDKSIDERTSIAGEEKVPINE